MDSLLDFAASSGAYGLLMGAPSVVPAGIVRTFRLCQGGLAATDRLLRFMEQSSNYVAMCKVGLELTGSDVAEVRPPYLMPPAAQREVFEELLNSVKHAFGSPPEAQP